MVARRTDAQKSSALRHLSAEVYLFGVDAADFFHGCGINHINSLLILMILLKGISAGIGNKKFSLVICDAFRFITNLDSIDNLECTDVYLGYKSFGKFAQSVDCTAFMSERRKIDIIAVGGKCAVVGHILCRSHSLTLRIDKLHNIRPVD